MVFIRSIILRVPKKFIVSLSLFCWFHLFSQDSESKQRQKGPPHQYKDILFHKDGLPVACWMDYSVRQIDELGIDAKLPMLVNDKPDKIMEDIILKDDSKCNIKRKFNQQWTP